MEDDLFSFAAGRQSRETESQEEPALELQGKPTPKGKQNQRQVVSVSELTRRIRDVLEGEFGTLWVEGEISNLRKQASGHQYFTLKDEGAQISCVLFRGTANRIRMELEDGLQIQVYGEISVYEPRGNYQLIVRNVKAKGAGSLQARFEALKQKLHSEGLFDEGLKRPIPAFPRTVCLVTSPTGAAVRDMLNILRRRAPWVRVLVYPVRVQGDGAFHEIVRALETLAEEGAEAFPRSTPS